MQLKLMHRVDYYIGIPLCFVFSIWEKIRRLTGTSSRKHPKKILFIELSEMGSAILAHSSIYRAQAFTDKENIFFLIFEKNRESVDILGIIPNSNIITINSSSLLKFLFSTLSAVVKLRRLKIDTTLDLELFSRCTVLLAYLSGARVRAGFDNYKEEGLYRGTLLTHRVMYNNLQHMSLNFLALFEAIKFDPSELPLTKLNVKSFLVELPVFVSAQSESERMQKTLAAKGLLKPQNAALYVLNPDPGILALRGWPVENFAALAARLINASPENYVVVVGLDSSAKYAKKIVDFCESERLLDLTGQTQTVLDLMALLSLAKCLVTNDSGPAHMASLTKIKNIVLYGPESPIRYAPLGANSISLFAGLACSPCYSAANHRSSICTNNVCMQSIPVEQVWEAIQDIKT